MKVSIVSKQDDNWHSNELLKRAKKLGLQASICDVTAQDIPGNLDKLGDVIVWRSSSLDGKSERTALAGYIKDKVVINEALFKLPATPFKYFQQNHIKSNNGLSVYSIPTYRARDTKELNRLIADKKLLLPFIAKPNRGAEGVGVLLIKTKSEISALLDIKEYVFQNFISNDGDWRIIVVGGTPLGAMKRIAKQGSHLNNVSQGATSIQETDEATLRQLYTLAGKAASLFHLSLCGVDVIRDQKTGKFYILEVNTVPAWDGEFGFQAMTGVDVPAKVMELAKEMADRKSVNTAQLVEQYFKKRAAISSYHEFHLASRLWLWSNDKWARGVLDEQEAQYLGKDTDETRKIIAGLIDRPPSLSNDSKKYRAPAFARYPKLFAYNQILYRFQFAQTIYGRDIGSIVREFINDQELIDTYNQLSKDDDALRRLTTHAVNFLFWTEYYFRGSSISAKLQAINSAKLRRLLPGYKDLVASGDLDAKSSLKSQLYLLSHAVIGKSDFYSTVVTAPGYRRFCVEQEKLIRANYFNLTLDVKLEFLVCCKLCDYQTDLEEVISREAEQSLSWAGNFIVDEPLGLHTVTNNLIGSEHRNTLYLLSQKPFQKQTEAKKKQLEPKTIGSFEKISLPDFNLSSIIAKIDTGASTGSLHATQIKEITLPTGKKALSFLPFGRKPAVIVSAFNLKRVWSSNGHSAMRYAIRTTVIMDGVQYPIQLTLADRTQLKKGVLIGRWFLRRQGFIVDVTKGRKYRDEVKS